MKIPEPTSGTADFSKTIALGGTYLSGYTNGTLNRLGQENSLANLIALQMRIAGAGSFEQPLMPDNAGLGLNSRPWISEFLTNYRLDYESDCRGIVSLTPAKNFLSLGNAGAYLSRTSSSVQNLSVPFATTADIINPALSSPYSPSNRNPYFNRFASSPGSVSMLDDAKSQSPTFNILWLGMEDIYEYARLGGFGKTIPTPTEFSSRLDVILSGLTANGGKGVIANIPALENFPFYTYINPMSLQLSQGQADSLNQPTLGIFGFTAGQNGFAIEFPARSGSYRQMRPFEKILLSVPSDSLKCYRLGVFLNITDRYCLDSLELENINSSITSYNAIIKQKADQYNLAFVDMNQYFQKVKAGIKVNGIDFNMTFISGGFLSMDGFTPTQKGYALMANEFIKSINLKYGATIPFVNCESCEGIKFP